MRMYKTTPEVELNIHIFEPQGHRPTDKRPAIVFFFGGGWIGGTPSQFFPQCEYLASRGMVAMSAEYRVESQHQTSPQKCLEDAKSAIRWIREHAEELGVDVDRLAAGGGSAGGHLAAAAATCDGFEDVKDNLSVSCRPNALVLFNPVFNNGPEGYGHERVNAYWEAFSPMHNISSSTPPTIVFFGTNDQHISVTVAEAYKHRMEEAGCRCDLYLYEGQPHGFFNFGNREYFVRTVTEMDRFLASLGYLQGEPTIQMEEMAS